MTTFSVGHFLWGTKTANPVWNALLSSLILVQHNNVKQKPGVFAMKGMESVSCTRLSMGKVFFLLGPVCSLFYISCLIDSVHYLILEIICIRTLEKEVFRNAYVFPCTVFTEFFLCDFIFTFDWNYTCCAWGPLFFPHPGQKEHVSFWLVNPCNFTLENSLFFILHAISIQIFLFFFSGIFTF